jgi:4-amino-4-deoxy-L-arabinose transferase-like glycosyltransferase
MSVARTPAVAEGYLDTGRFAASRATARSWRVSRPWVAVAALAVAGLAIRLIQVRGIWVDEAISVHQAHMPLAAMLGDLRAGDNHPPLFFLALWGAVRLLGNSEQAVRVPSLIAGTLLVPAMFLCGRELFDRRTGLLAAAATAVAPLLIWYSQESRPYAMFMLVATLAVWAQARAIRDGRARYWVAYAAATIAVLYTHYFSILPIAIQQVAFGAVAWRRARRGEAVRPLLTGCWLTWLAVAIAVAPLAPFVHQQFLHDQVAGTGFQGAPSAGATSASLPQGKHPDVYAVIANVVWAIWGYHANATMLRLAALWPMLMLLALALLGRGRSRPGMLVLALAIIPPLLLMIVGFKKRDLFEVRYFSGAVPMLLLLSARTIVSSSRRRLPVILGAVVLLATMGFGAADQQLAKSNPRDYDFRSALRTVSLKARPGDTLLYAPDYLQDVIEYYGPHVHTEILGPHAPSIPAHGRVFLLASFLEQPGVPSSVGLAKYALARAHRRLVATTTLEKIYVWEYR